MSDRDVVIHFDSPSIMNTNEPSACRRRTVSRSSRGNPASSQASYTSFSSSIETRKTFTPVRSSAAAKFNAAYPNPNDSGAIDETNSIKVTPSSGFLSTTNRSDMNENQSLRGPVPLKKFL